MLFSNEEHFDITTIRDNANGSYFSFVNGFVCKNCGYCVLSNKRGICPITNILHDIDKNKFMVFKNLNDQKLMIEPNSQKGWGHCRKCEGLNFKSSLKDKTCVNGTNHDNNNDEDYYIPANLQQSDIDKNFGIFSKIGYNKVADMWWCNKCSILTDKTGICPTDGKNHDVTGSSNYKLPMMEDYPISAVGRYIQIIRMNDKKKLPLHIARVRIYEEGYNLVPESEITTFASSIFNDDVNNFGHKYLTDYDYKFPDKYARTKDETTGDNSPTFLLDLGKTRNLQKIRIENRQDCCGDILIGAILNVIDDKKNYVFSKVITSGWSPQDFWFTVPPIQPLPTQVETSTSVVQPSQVETSTLVVQPSQVQTPTSQVQTPTSVVQPSQVQTPTSVVQPSQVQTVNQSIVSTTTSGTYTCKSGEVIKVV
jgi:hypothetical protein